MPLSATILFSIGPMIGKALLKILLEDSPLLKDIAPDVLDLLKEQAKAERGGQADQMSAIAEAVALRLKPIIADARLNDDDLAAVLRECMLTLREVKAEQLVDARMRPGRMARALFTVRPDATKTLSANEAALYERLVKEASIYVTAIASEFVGFNNLRDATLLQDNEHILQTVLALLQRPNQESAAFEQEYRSCVRRELNTLEMFGVPRLKDAMERQQLDMAYVTRRNPPQATTF